MRSLKVKYLIINVKHTNKNRTTQSKLYANISNIKFTSKETSFFVLFFRLNYIKTTSAFTETSTGIGNAQNKKN